MKKIVLGMFVVAATVMAYVAPVLAACGGW
jgi:hypothetical protein